MSISDLVEMRADTDEERTLLWHVRGACHDGSKCLLCQASARANRAELRFESVISGDPMRFPTKADAMREVFGVRPRMAAPRAPYITLQEMVDAFHVAIPKDAYVHGARLETLKWMRRQEAANGHVLPDTESIRDYYSECLGTPDESGGC